MRLVFILFFMLQLPNSSFALTEAELAEMKAEYMNASIEYDRLRDESYIIFRSSALKRVPLPLKYFAVEAELTSVYMQIARLSGILNEIGYDDNDELCPESDD
jgi:hypothetical protein